MVDIKEKEKLRIWITDKTRELQDKLENLPDEPTSDAIDRYEFLTTQLLKLSQMRAKHFPPVKDPDPRFKDVLY